jgi:hypothetical protein
MQVFQPWNEKPLSLTEVFDTPVYEDLAEDGVDAQLSLQCRHFGGIRL